MQRLSLKALQLVSLGNPEEMKGKQFNSDTAGEVNPAD